MEGDLASLIKISLMVVALMAYCRLVSSYINPGKLRLLALLPVLLLLPTLPFRLTSVNLRGLCSFFLSWLGIFKLLLLSFGLGPLSPSLPLLPFIATASLPVKLKPEPSSTKPTSTPTPTSTLRRLLQNSAFKIVLLLCFLQLHAIFNLESHPNLLIIYYCFLIYLTLECNLTIVAAFGSALGLVLEPQFNAPLRSTSLTDFWGRRWNLMVTNILRESVYTHVTKMYGKATGVMAVFLVSGFMHEVMFYYITLELPTGEVSLFFLIHGVAVVLEGMARRGGWLPRPAVLLPFEVALIGVTLTWLFFPPLIRDGRDEIAMREMMEVMMWVKGVGRWLVERLTSPVLLRQK